MVKYINLKSIGLNVLFSISSICIAIPGYAHVPKDINYIFDLRGIEPRCVFFPAVRV